MIDYASLLIGKAWADDAVAQAPALDSGTTLMQFVPLFAIFLVFYLLILRPQQKKLDTQLKVLKELKKGDKVITAGGFVGTITKLESDAYVMVELASGVQVKTVRSTITGLAEEPKPANDTSQP